MSPRALKLRGLFDPIAVQKLLQSDREGRVDAAYPIFAIICIELWCQIFLIGFQAGKKAFFLYLFSKNSRDNIEHDEMKALKRLTKYYLTLKPSEIKAALQCCELKEVSCIEKET